jgi:peptide/nickel transport system substrate-binding protein
MSTLRKCFCIAIVVLLLSVSLSTTYGQIEKPKYGGVLVVGLYTDPVTLNPDITWSWSTHAICSAVYQRLFGFHVNETEFIPELALNWEASEDGRTYTFHLTRNATFHDGVAFTSADVKFSFEQVLINYLGPYSAMKDILDLPTETPDNYTWVLKLKQPDPDLLVKLTYYGFYILPKHLFEGQNMTTTEQNWNPVGTGPFVFKEFVKGSHAIIERNPNYWKTDLPYLDRLVFTIIPNSQSRIMAMDKHEIDFLLSWPPHLEGIPRWEEDSSYSVIKTPGVVGPPEVVINHNDSILKDLTVRKALALATDKQYILERLGPSGTAYMVDGPIPTIWKEWHNPAAEQIEFNVSEANRLLDDAGYLKDTNGKRFDLSIIYDPTNIDYVTIAECFAGMMDKNIGVHVTLLPYETAVFYIKLGTSDFQLAVFGMSRGPDVGKGLTLYWSETIPLPGTLTDITLFRNSTYDQLYMQQRVETNVTKRKEMIYRMQEILVDQVAGIWMPEAVDFSVATAKFKNLPMDAYTFETFETTWSTDGIDVSPSDVMAAISSAEQFIKSVEGTRDVEQAKAKLAQAKEKFNPSDSTTWIEAKSLAEEAARLVGEVAAEPPYWLYGAVIAAVVVVAAVGVYAWRKRKMK